MSRRIATLATVFLSAFVLTVPRAQGQLWTTLDLGGAVVRYGDSVDVTATTVSPRIRLDQGAFTGNAGGTMSSLMAGGWTGQGSIDMSMLTGALGPARLELAAEAGGSLHDDATRTGQYLGRARLHVGSGVGGLWAGAASGKTWDASVWYPVAQGDFGAWVRLGDVRLVALLAPTSVGDSLRYTDAQGALRWDTGRMELTVGMGARSGSRIPSDAATWGSLVTTFWLTSHVGVVAAGGTYPTDHTQGYPGGRYVSLAVRFGGRPHPASVLSSRSAPGAGLARASGPRVEIAALPNGRQVVRVYAPGARNVEVMGDFTGWRPVTLARGTGGWWVAPEGIAPGIYQLNVRVNDGPWDVPAGALDRVDEFGVRVGVLHVR